MPFNPLPMLPITGGRVGRKGGRENITPARTVVYINRCPIKVDFPALDSKDKPTGSHTKAVFEVVVNLYRNRFRRGRS